MSDPSKHDAPKSGGKHPPGIVTDARESKVPRDRNEKNMNPSPWTTRLVDAPADDMLDAYSVAKLFGVSKDTLDRMVTDGEFPGPLKVGKTGKLWEWRAVAYYRLRLEFLPRIAGQDAANDG